MSKSINKQRDNFPKQAHKAPPVASGIAYPVPVHPAFLAKLTAVWEEGQTLQRELQALQLRFNDIMDLAKAVQVEAGQIDPIATLRDIKAGWILPPPPEPQTGPQQAPPAPVSAGSVGDEGLPANVDGAPAE